MKDKPDILPVAQDIVPLRRHGHEWVGLCPLHKEKTPSFSVNVAKQCFYCQGCGQGGDVYDLVMRRFGVDFKEAHAMIGKQEFPQVSQAAREQAPPKRKTSKPPLNAAEPSFHCHWGTPSHVWAYLDTDGSLIHYVTRYDGDDGKKTPQWTWDGFRWGMGHYSGKRPLYNLHQLAARPDDPVLICEGEKATDAAALLFPDSVCVTWSGGANAVDKAEWSALDGRKTIVIWPDADDAGVRAANEIFSLFPHAQVLQTEGRAKGWDAADAVEEGCGRDDIFRFQPAAQPQADTEPPRSLHIDAEAVAEPFDYCGYDGGIYYYLPEEKRQIIDLTAAGHTQNNLLQLASLDFWQGRYPVGKGRDGTASWADAASDLMRKSHHHGIYNPENLRGRGAWLDKGRKVVHLGETLLINGEQSRPGRLESSRHIYEARAGLDVRHRPSATTKRANRLVDLCESLSWENPLSADLLAGWIVLAPICGILRWRPHVWLSGSSGSGKSTVTKDIVTPMVGQFALKIEGTTTEPAIRQSMGKDARPVIFDEAEGETKEDQDRIQRIINLARVSSSGGNITKGGANGRATDYSVRSCFFFASINSTISHYADETRISKLILRRDETTHAEDNYGRILALIHELMHEEYAGEMFARSVEHLNVIEENCRIFTTAAARVFHNRRAADQIGTLLAGRYLCNSSKRIDQKTAEDWIAGRSWNDHTALGANSDEMRLLTYLCSRTVRVSTATGFKEVSVGEIIVGVARQGASAPFIIDDGVRTLGRLGIRVQDENFAVANVSPPLSKLLEGTTWGRDWKRPLRMVPGAEVAPKPVYFAPGLFERATMLPVSLIEN